MAKKNLRRKLLTGLDEIFSCYKATPTVQNAVSAGILVPNANVLLVGVPGTGKTTLIRMLAKAFFGDSFEKISFSQNITPFDVFFYLNLGKLSQGVEEITPRPILKAKYRLFNECLVPDSQILMGTGEPVRIDEIARAVGFRDKDEGWREPEENLEVLSLNKDFETENKKVTGVFRKRANKILKIKLRHGPELLVTPSHPFLVGSEMHTKEAKDLERGDFIAALSSIDMDTEIQTVENELMHWTHETARLLGVSTRYVRKLCDSGKIKAIKTDGGHWRIPETELAKYLGRTEKRPPYQLDGNLAYLTGLIGADGHVFSNGSTIKLEIINREEDVLVEKFKDIAKSIFGVDCKERYDKKRGTRIVWFNSKPAKTLLEKLGVISGKKSSKVRVPPAIVNSPEGVIREYVKGWFDAEGSVSKDRIKLATCVIG